MNPRTTSSYYARESASAHRELGAARTEAARYRALLVEADAALRTGVVAEDLAERIRLALIGEIKSMTVAEAIKAAADRLERETGAAR